MLYQKTPEVWADFRSRLAALLHELHDAAQAPHTPGTTGIGVTAMVFPLREAASPGGTADEDPAHPDE
jgi:hypothetical protein